ncbi:MAG: glycosyltransferase family 4 protein [Oceanospirillaceae bacterium]|nr:glycosyltransferase family 4 protein [Oceanospirillaceae bacterium]
MNKSPKCKMLIITDTYVGQPGGSERHLYNFMCGVSGDFDIDVIQLNPSGNPGIADGFLHGRENIRLLSMPLQSLRSVNSLRVLWRMWRLSAAGGKQLVVSYHEKADVLNWVLSMLPLTKTRHISSKRDMGFKLAGKLKQLMHKINKKFYAITAPSESIAEQMRTDYGVASEKIHTIHNGVDLELYQVKKDVEKQVYRDQLSIPQDKTILLSIGWLKPIKGYEYLLDALAKLNNEYPSKYYLLIVGEGPLLESLSAQADRLHIAHMVRFTGIQKNVQDWMAAADLVVSATLSEGLSNALVEATASGLPVIATKVGGNPEVVEDGFNGLLVPSQDSKALCAALIDIAENKETFQRMCVNARVKAERDFSNVSMVHKLESIYLAAKAS